MVSALLIVADRSGRGAFAFVRACHLPSPPLLPRCRHARMLRGKWTPGLPVRPAPAIFADCHLRRRFDIDARPRLAGSVIENLDNSGYSLGH